MAVTSAQIVDFLVANPGMTDAQIVAAMETFQISPAQMASAVGLKEAEVVARIVPVLAQDVAQNGLYTQTIANNETGQTEITQRTLPLGFNAYQDESGQLSYSRVDPAKPDKIQLYGSQGEYRGEEKITTSTQDLIRNLGPIALAAGGSALVQGLLGGAAIGAAGTVGSTGLTMAELAQLDLALGGAGGTAGATALANSLTTGALTGTLTNLTGGSGTGALTGALGGTVAGMGGGTGLTAGAGGLGLSTTGAGLGAAGTGAGITAGTGLGTGVLAGSGLGTTLLGTGAGTALGTGVLAGSGLGTTLAGLGAGGSLLGTAATGLGVNNLANLLSGGLGTAGNLLQMQQSKEAALAAQKRIDAETSAAKQSAAFRPIGMTTRFGTSQFAVDPVTGQLTSAGYTLSPEAKNAQDRLVKLAESGLQQAEGAQQAFEPLQTGAQSLFKLGQGYLAETPEAVAANYLKSQMALLQPGREIELANLQNRLAQQGRTGLSVAQGGTMGATTPELQALFNARARQEAELAANAQLAGQAQIQYGVGLLGQGAGAMGQYYGGQQQAYAPYTTALGQVQGLETAAQQPLQMGASLGQTASTAGARVGALGLEGANISQRLATGANATTNPYAQALMAAGNPNAMFGQSLGNVFGGLFS
jgi:hypothetical protein